MTYDEFGLLHENAEEAGLDFDRPPAVRREHVALPDGRRLAAVVWGEGDPEMVLLHGGAQNAHTWDTVALALDRPLVCLDLPGHGHSDWNPDGYTLDGNADDVAVAMEALAPAATTVVGMSLGGMTSIALASRHPGLVPRLALVDVTPGVDHGKASTIMTFISGPESFADFDEILERTIEFNPTRSLASLRRGVLHNAHELPDGTWAWRYDRNLPAGLVESLPRLWDVLEALHVPLMLVRGGDSPVVADEDVEELRRRRPDARVEVVAGAGHSIQGDRPLELALLLADFHAS